MKRKEKGFALPVSLLLLVVMTLMGATLVSITVGDIRANNEIDYSQQAFYAAESGITNAKKYLKTEKTLTPQGDPNNNLKFDYNFSVDSDFESSNYNLFKTDISVNKFVV